MVCSCDSNLFVECRVKGGLISWHTQIASTFPFWALKGIELISTGLVSLRVGIYSGNKTATNFELWTDTLIMKNAIDFLHLEAILRHVAY